MKKGSAWLGVASLLLLGCGAGNNPFPGAADDLEDLGRSVLDALNRGDEEGLAEVRLSEREHNEVVWPELPAAESDNPYVLEFAWQNIQMRNGRAVRRLTHDLESMIPMAYEGVECRGETQSFETFRVRTDCWVQFFSKGGFYEAQLFKDVLERDGGHKIFRYYDESPRKLAGVG